MEVFDIGGHIAEYYTENTFGYNPLDYFEINDDSYTKSTYIEDRVIKE